MSRISLGTAPQCLSQHYLQQAGHGSNTNVHPQRNGYRRCAIYTQWSITQPQKEQSWVICRDVNGPRVSHTEWGKVEREKQVSYINAYRWNLEKRADASIARTSQMALVIKNPPANAGDIRDVGLILASGRFAGGGHGNPLQYSCLKNPYGQRSLVGESPYSHRVRHDWCNLSHTDLFPEQKQRHRHRKRTCRHSMGEGSVGQSERVAVT